MGPLGTLIHEPVFDKEAIVYATLELSDLTEARVRAPILLGNFEARFTDSPCRWTLILLEVTLVLIYCKLHSSDRCTEV